MNSPISLASSLNTLRSVLCRSVILLCPTQQIHIDIWLYQTFIQFLIWYIKTHVYLPIFTAERLLVRLSATWYSFCMMVPEVRHFFFFFFLYWHVPYLFLSHTTSTHLKDKNCYLQFRRLNEDTTERSVSQRMLFGTIAMSRARGSNNETSG